MLKNFEWNQKRIYCFYRELELKLCIKPRKRLVRDKPEVLRCRKLSIRSGPWTLCIDPAVSAQARLLKHKPQQGFAPGGPFGFEFLL